MGSGKVAPGRGIGEDNVGGVNDCARGRVVESLAVEQPAPAALAQVVERLAGHEAEGSLVVSDALDAARLGAGPEAPEQVEVDEDVFDLITRHAGLLIDTGGVGGGQLGTAGAWVCGEPRPRKLCATAQAGEGAAVGRTLVAVNRISA